jgi:hypothetical protein
VRGGAGGDDAALLRELRDELPKAQIERVDKAATTGSLRQSRMCSGQLGWRDAPVTALPPFDLRASAFQWPRVAGIDAHSGW